MNFEIKNNTLSLPFKSEFIFIKILMTKKNQYSISPTPQ
jgi:hypothetical protein